MDQFKLMITGGRDFHDYAKLCCYAETAMSNRRNDSEPLIVSDALEGAGMLGGRYAAENGLEVAEFLPDEQDDCHPFKKFEKMAAYADMCLYFWNGMGDSIGELIAIARKEELEMIIVSY